MSNEIVTPQAVTTGASNYNQVDKANYDQAEIAKFSAMASSWWSPSGSFRLIHLVNPLRTKYIVDQFFKATGKVRNNLTSAVNNTAPLQGVKALDVGCGAGILSEALYAQGATVSAIDMSEAALTVARLHAQDKHCDISYHQATAEEFAHQHAGQFPLVTCMEMLEHVPNIQSTLSALAQLVAPGGVLVVSTINKTWQAQLQMIELAENVLNWLPRGTHEYHKFITPAELVAMAQQCGLEMVDLQGYKYAPVFNSFYLSPKVDVNYMMVFRKAV